jgi:WD40 repeat protein
LSPDVTTLASVGCKYGKHSELKIWDVAAGIVKATGQGSLYYPYCVMFSPDGAKVATAGRDRLFRLWHVNTGELDRIFGRRSEGWIQSLTYPGHTDWINSVS